MMKTPIASQSVLRTLLPPLLAMVFFTTLMGITAVQLTQQWRGVVEDTLQRLVIQQFHHNVRWELLRIDKERQHKPEIARSEWDKLCRIIVDLQTLDQKRAKTPLSIDRPYIPLKLAAFCESPDNIAHIAPFLQTDMLKPSQQYLVDDLKQFQNQSQSITVIVAGSILLLALILMTITAIDIHKLFNALQQAQNNAQTIQEAERRRISQELHDGIIQSLIDFKRKLQLGPAEALSLDKILVSIRRICQALKPQILEDLGLHAALMDLWHDFCEEMQAQYTTTAIHGKTSPLQLRFYAEPNEVNAIPELMHLDVYRVIQELLTNIRKHAGATSVTLTVVYAENEPSPLRIVLKDNGIGMPDSEALAMLNTHSDDALPKKALSTLGVSGIRHRVASWGGAIRWQAGGATGEIPTGTLVQVTFPRKI